jgi:hypothetical protein
MTAFVRVIRPWLIGLVILAVVLAAAAISPVVQTWWVNRTLDRRGVPATVGSFWATPGSIEVSDLRWADGAQRISIGRLELDVPVKAALWDGNWAISHLVAKDVSVEFGPTGDTAGSATTGSSPAAATRSTPASSTGSAGGPKPRLWANVTIAHAEVEGDITTPLPWAKNPVHAHAVLAGGEVAPNKTAEFTVDVAGSGGDTAKLASASAQGKLRVTIDGDRIVQRLEFQGVVASPDRSLPKDMTIALGAAFGGAAGTRFDARIERAGRTALVASAQYSAAAGRFAGEWKADLTPGDVSLLAGRKMPFSLAIGGTGKFEADPEFRAVHADGTAEGDIDGLGAVLPLLPRMSPSHFSVDFEAARAGAELRLGRFHAKLGESAAPIAEWAATQPATINLTTFQVRTGDSEFARIVLRGVPTQWLPIFADRWQLSQSAFAGELVASTHGDRVEVKTIQPLRAPGATLLDGTKVLGKGLEVVVPLTAAFTPKNGWRFHTEGGTVTIGGETLANGTFDVMPVHEPYRTAEFTGKLHLDLPAARHHTPWSGIRGHAVDIDASGHLGPAADVSAKIRVTGESPTTFATAQLEANVEDYRSITFHLPMTIAIAEHSSDLSIDGTVADRADARHIDVNISGKTVDLAALRILADITPLAPAVHAVLPIGAGATGSKEPPSAAPFWGNVVGRLRVSADRVVAGAIGLDGAEANFAFTPDRIELHGAHVAYNPTDLSKRVRRSEDLSERLEPISRFTADATLGWDANAQRYAFDATAGVDAIDGARLFGQPPPNHKPQLEGRWSVTDHLVATGATLPELVRERHHTYKLASTAGALRLLDVSIGDALPDAPTPVSDAATSVGSAVTWLFGVKKGALERENHLSKGTEAVLNFTYAVKELPYDTAEIEVEGGTSGTLQVSRFDVASPNLRLHGGGTVGSQPSTLGDRPLTLTLALAVDGPYAKQLASTTLLAPKDPNGWSAFREPVRISGTLNAPNKTLWHDELARAAVAAQKK